MTVDHDQNLRIKSDKEFTEMGSAALSSSKKTKCDYLTVGQPKDLFNRIDVVKSPRLKT